MCEPVPRLPVSYSTPKLYASELSPFDNSGNREPLVSGPVANLTTKTELLCNALSGLWPVVGRCGCLGERIELSFTDVHFLVPGYRLTADPWCYGDMGVSETRTLCQRTTNSTFQFLHGVSGSDLEGSITHWRRAIAISGVDLSGLVTWWAGKKGSFQVDSA